MDKRKLGLLVALVAAVAIAIFFWQRSRGGEDAAQKASRAAAGKTGPATPKRMSSSSGDQQRAQRPPPVSMDDDPEGPLRLEGQVLDQDDRPVGGAVVTLSSNPQRSASTENDGSFFFDKLVGRTYAVRARTGSQIGGPVLHKLTATSGPVVVRLRMGAKVVVTVVARDTDEPVSSANVQIRSSDLQSETTDSEGKATFDGVPSGNVALVASAPGYGPTRQLLQVPDTDGANVSARVVLQPGAEVSGRVISEKGKPVPGVRVLANDVARLFSLQSQRLDAATTDEKGRFTIPAVSAGTYRFAANHDDYAPSTSEPVAVDGSTPVKDVEITLRDGGTLAGRVVDKHGQGSAWAVVRVGDERAIGGFDENMLRQATADEDGEFSMKGLPRTRLSAIAIAEHASSDIAKADLSAKSEVRGILLTLTVEGMIAGKVVDSDAEPVAEAQVTALPDVFSSGISEDIALRGISAQTTDGGGRFAFKGLPDGTYRLRASRASVSTRAFMQPGKQAATGDTDVTLLLAKNGGIEGRLLYKDGSAVEVFTVTVSIPPGIPVTDEKGEFELLAIPPGKYDITFRGPEFSDLTRRGVEVKPGVTTEMGTVNVPRGRYATGRVLDRSGAPVAAATVVVARQLIGDGMSVTTDLGGGAEEFLGLRRDQTDEDGAFRVRGISATTEMLIVAEHVQRGRSLPQVVPPGENNPEYELRLRPFGSLFGEVTLGGEPAKGMNVVVTPKGARNHNIVAKAGADGSYLVEHVPAGEHVVMAMKGKGLGGSYASASITIEGGKKYHLDLDIEVGNIELDVIIKGKGDAKIDLAQVFLFKGDLAPKTGKEVQEAFLSAGSAGNAKMAIALGGAPAEFHKVTPRSYSVCVIPVNGDMNDPSFQLRLQENVDKLKVYCSRHTVAQTPAEQTYTAVVPPMDPLPEPKPEPK